MRIFVRIKLYQTTLWCLNNRMNMRKARHYLCVIPAGNALIFGSAKKRRMKKLRERLCENHSEPVWTLAIVHHGQPLSVFKQIVSSKSTSYGVG